MDDSVASSGKKVSCKQPRFCRLSSDIYYDQTGRLSELKAGNCSITLQTFFFALQPVLMWKDLSDVLLDLTSYFSVYVSVQWCTSIAPG